MKYHIAQVNIGRIKASLEDPLMAGFVRRLDEINALADNSPGFVWRLHTSEGHATYLRSYDDDRILVNMSVSGNRRSAQALCLPHGSCGALAPAA